MKNIHVYVIIYALVFLLGAHCGSQRSHEISAKRSWFASSNESGLIKVTLWKHSDGSVSTWTIQPADLGRNYIMRLDGSSAIIEPANPNDSRYGNITIGTDNTILNQGINAIYTDDLNIAVGHSAINASEDTTGIVELDYPADRP